MSERRILLDRGVGEDRGVVLLDGLAERLLIARAGDDPRERVGARLAARVRKVEPAFASAFLDIGDGAEALLGFKPDRRPVEGQMLEVEVRSEPRPGKLATVRVVGPSEGKPRLLSVAPDLATLLKVFAPDAEITVGREAREAADRAEIEAMEVVHGLPAGGTISIEPTRALVAIDVDLGERKGADAKRLTRQANLAALAAAARLLRLKGLGGIVVIDLVGRGHDGTALLAAARTAFAPDNPGVAIGPVGRFGTMELLAPRHGRSVAEILLGPDGRLSEQTLAIRMIRKAQGEAMQYPGARLEGVCSPAVAVLAGPLGEALCETIGQRFVVRADAGTASGDWEVRRL